MDERVVLGMVDAVSANVKREVDKDDYIGEDGLLHCGKCGGKKETIVTIELSNRKIPKKVNCICKCEQERRRKKELEDQQYRIREAANTRRVESLMDKRFYNARFENCKITEHNKKNLDICRKYVSAFDKMQEKNQGLLFWGDIGTGKSFAAACIANELMEKGVSVVMTSFVKLLEMIQGQSNEEDILRRIMKSKLVIFDDLGAERSTDYAMEKVYNIIDSRYRSNLPMIMTTNLELNDMFRETDIRYKRIYDRIFEVCYPMHWTGPSFRKLEAKDRFDEMAKLLEE